MRHIEHTSWSGLSRSIHAVERGQGIVAEQNRRICLTNRVQDTPVPRPRSSSPVSRHPEPIRPYAHPNSFNAAPEFQIFVIDPILSPTNCITYT